MRHSQNQSGFALLFFVLVLMGLGGVALTASIHKTQNLIAKNKKAHNTKVLNEAKQALLFYAYNYPNFNAQGPGHLPCPFNTETGYDNDLDGIDDGIRNLNICTSVGRFPYNIANMNFYEAKDADEEHLWYAVSDNFYNLAPGVNINSDSVGTITVFDQSGNVMYDGATNGIAAIIIAPGKAMARDDDGDGVYDYTQVRSTAAEKINPKNYLDAYNGFDNSTFVNTGNALAEGFTLGPTFGDTKQEIVMNDQMVIVTTDEVLEMAEKAVLDQYAEAIRIYQNNTGGNYPWLYDYNVSSLSEFPDTSGLKTIGRIPSIYSEYFVEDTSEKIDSDIGIFYVKVISFPGNPNTSFILNGTSVVTKNVGFEDIVKSDNFGELSSDTLSTSLTSEKFYYNNSGSWVLCGVTISDCDASIATTAKVLKISMVFDMSTNFSFDYSTAPAIGSIAPAAGTYARKTVIFDSSKVNAAPVNIVYEKMEVYTSGSGSFTADATLTKNVLDNADFNDAGVGITVQNQTVSNLVLSIRYHPVLPKWAFDEGWFNSVQMAFSAQYQPGGPAVDCIGAANCLNVTDLANSDSVISLLTIAGQNNIINDLGVDFSDDVTDIFEAENANLDNNFVSRAGNDRILILREQ